MQPRGPFRAFASYSSNILSFLSFFVYQISESRANTPPEWTGSLMTLNQSINQPMLGSRTMLDQRNGAQSVLSTVDNAPVAESIISGVAKSVDSTSASKKSTSGVDSFRAKGTSSRRLIAGSALSKAGRMSQFLETARSRMSKRAPSVMSNAESVLDFGMKKSGRRQGSAQSRMSGVNEDWPSTKFKYKQKEVTMVHEKWNEK
jgi:hypothetical protein